MGGGGERVRAELGGGGFSDQERGVGVVGELDERGVQIDSLEEGGRG